MDVVVLLSRLQFAVATFFHFIFVPLTLGLSVMIAIMETQWVRTGDEAYKRMARFWGKIFLLNFALGVVTGITLEFQFGTNWSRYSTYVGDIFGSLLAIEATVAFFLESTFVAVWAFGWNKLTPKMHAVSIWLVAAASNISALWILLANGFMQHPVGYVLRNGRAELDNFLAVITNSFGWQEFIHTVSGSWMLAGFFVLGVSSYHLLRRREKLMFTRSFKLGAAFALIFSLVVAVQGHFHGGEVAATQPTKLAAMESHWDTDTNVPMYLFLVPDPANERNLVEFLPVPGFLSFLAFDDFNAEVQGLKDFPKEDRPPVLLTFLAFRGMVGLGTLFILVAGWAFIRRNRLDQSRTLLRLLPWFIPLPYIAIQLGWIVAEVGRQPWIVYGIMRTQDAVSPVGSYEVGLTLTLFTVIYSALGLVYLYLLRRFIIQGPAAPEAAI